MKTILISFFAYLLPHLITFSADYSQQGKTADIYTTLEHKGYTLTKTSSSSGGIIGVYPLKIYDNDVAGGASGIDRLITIKNTGAGVLSVSNVSITGANNSEFLLSGLPPLSFNINSEDSVSFSVAFNPSSTGIKTASVDITSDDASNPVTSIPLRGLGTSGLGGANEPSLQSILNLLEIQTNVGDDNIATAVINSSTSLQKAPLLGDEVSIQQFQKAGAGPVTITPLAVFGPTTNNPIVGLGWYKSGDTSSKSELLTVSNSPVSNGQTVNVNYTGTLTFDPSTANFGFYSNWPVFANRHLFSEDNLNTFSGSIPHHVRIYPYKVNSVSIPNSYLVAFEETITNLDFQDIVFIVNNVQPAVPLSSVTVFSLADAFVRNGGTSNTNYGSDTSLGVKGSPLAGSTRFSYLKFPVNVSNVKSAKLRLYGSNTESSSNILLSSFGVNDDSWTEGGINFNNAPAASTARLSSVMVNAQAKYYEFDVTDFVKFQQAGDKIASFVIKDPANGNNYILFNSKENNRYPPQLVIDTSTAAPSNASMFIENLDKFPSNDNFVFSRIQIPWTRDTVYNANHDSLKVRIHNNGTNPLIISDLTLSNDTTWKIDKLNGVTYVPGSGLPISINSGTYIDVTLKFIAMDQATRVKVLHETLTITSNDDKYPVKTIFLHGLWQLSGEGGHEPYVQEIINSFGFTTRTGFVYTDPDLGDSSKIKGDEIKPSYFVKADTTLPVTVRQMAAYHKCCHSPEKIQWYAKDSTTVTSIFTQLGLDGQSVLPRRNLPSTGASGTINPTTPFGFKVGGSYWTDAAKNSGSKIAIRVYKAFDMDGNIIPDSYILCNDYIGGPATNYDYNDNTYFVSNLRPEIGASFSSTLKATPSDLDFGDKVLQTDNSLLLSIKNLGQTYANGSSDPAITISSIDITGENRFEFSAALPASTTLDPQQTSSITVNFKPVSQGLKIADLLIYYNNSQSPLRVPLYGIGRASDTTVVVNYRIKSGYSTPITINGKTWSADTPYAFDNLAPYSNPALSDIAGTDEDSLYLTEQSSNGNTKPFRYEIPVPNGDYVVRLHFAEIYWGAPGSGLSGGAGSRVMSVELENQLRLANFDIDQEVGVATAVVKNFPVTVTDGKLNIDFSALVNRPSVSAIEVYSFVSSGALPVNDLNLKGILVDNGVELSWTNTNEADTKYYQIERSTNNIDFTVLGKVSANNLTNYNFIDDEPNGNNNFYRIKQFSADGKFTYSKIVRIDYAKAFSMKFFPNPASHKLVIQFNGAQENQKANLVIQSLSGSVLKKLPIVLSNQRFDVDVSSLSSGVYIVSVKGENFVINKKFIKHN